MAGFDKCCYFIDLSTGCYIIAALYLIFCFVSMVCCSVDVHLGKARVCYLAWGESFSLTTFTTITFAAAIIISVLMLVFVAIFIYGLTSVIPLVYLIDQGQLLVLFMAYLFMYHAVNFLLLMIIACYVNSWIIFFHALISIGMGVLWLLTVYSEYTRMPTMEEE